MLSLLLKNVFRMLALSFSNYVFEYLRWSIMRNADLGISISAA